MPAGTFSPVSIVARPPLDAWFWGAGVLTCSVTGAWLPAVAAFDGAGSCVLAARRAAEGVFARDGFATL